MRVVIWRKRTLRRLRSPRFIKRLARRVQIDQRPSHALSVSPRRRPQSVAAPKISTTTHIVRYLAADKRGCIRISLLPSRVSQRGAQEVDGDKPIRLVHNHVSSAKTVVRYDHNLELRSGLCSARKPVAVHADRKWHSRECTDMASCEEECHLQPKPVLSEIPIRQVFSFCFHLSPEIIRRGGRSLRLSWY